MTTPSTLTRRDCLKQVALTGAAFTTLPSRLRGQNAPSKRVNLALIGTGRIVLASNLKTLLAMKTIPISLPSGLAQWLFQGPPAESKFLAANNRKGED